MSTKYDENPNRYAPSGYEGQNFSEDYSIPSCGLEDVDKAMFNLFDKQIPLYHTLSGEKKRVPIIFATGERFALLRRKKPIVDKKGALILPLISITRSSLENVPSKGISNNQMFPHVITKKLSKKDMIYRQLENKEKLSNVQDNPKIDEDSDFSLEYSFRDNIVETIEIPPIKYFGANYEITIWSSFTQQMNKILESIMGSYTLNPGQQFRIESDKGYWFPAFVEQSLSQDASYADFTDAERYIKYSMTISATGYIIAPNIDSGKTALRSFISSPKVNFEVSSDYVELDPKYEGIQDSNANANVYDDLRTEDCEIPAGMIGVDSLRNVEELQKIDKTKGFSSRDRNKKYDSDLVGIRGSDYKKEIKTFVRDKNGELVPIMAKTSSSQGETLYDARLGEVLFNISNED